MADPKFIKINGNQSRPRQIIAWILFVRWPLSAETVHGPVS